MSPAASLWRNYKKKFLNCYNLKNVMWSSARTLTAAPDNCAICITLLLPRLFASLHCVVVGRLRCETQRKWALHTNGICKCICICSLNFSCLPKAFPSQPFYNDSKRFHVRQDILACDYLIQDRREPHVYIRYITWIHKCPHPMDANQLQRHLQVPTCATSICSRSEARWAFD